jgi:hypothetical protein
MSKASEKNVSNYFFDNPSLKSSASKKASGCAEILDCVDDETELWVLQCPKCFDVDKLVGTSLRKSADGKVINLSSDRFKCPVNMVCLAPEKATEYKSVCDQIKLIQPMGKIIVTEQEAPPCQQEDMTCSEKDQTDDECSQVSAVDSCTPSLAPVASKKVQKKMNDQRFTIETTVTVENVGNDRGKKRKSTKIDSQMQEPCLPFVPPEPSPMKRKSTKKC